MARSNTVLRRFFDGPTSYDVFHCEAGDHEFSRATVQGVKPMNCPDHGGSEQGSQACRCSAGCECGNGE